jgi:hypothetical protein
MRSNLSIAGCVGRRRLTVCVPRTVNDAVFVDREALSSPRGRACALHVAAVRAKPLPFGADYPLRAIVSHRPIVMPDMSFDNHVPTDPASPL